ncbi:hypothetical protein PVL29_018775 [Vitis rotundifolia]|uniref:Uncharacterized protein n=1 Tax=Vitis rotundifolia TaxID=103349 RepID=A0AA39DGA7_VITRO|nr:hypothetical protein PVL29_018775 [Vitis rotundifolia]
MGWPPKSLRLRDRPRGDNKRTGDPADGPISSAATFSLPLEPALIDPGPDPLKEGPCKLSSLAFFKPSGSTARPEEDGPTERRSTGVGSSTRLETGPLSSPCPQHPPALASHQLFVTAPRAQLLPFLPRADRRVPHHHPEPLLWTSQLAADFLPCPIS